MNKEHLIYLLVWKWEDSGNLLSSQKTFYCITCSSNLCNEAAEKKKQANELVFYELFSVTS